MKRFPGVIAALLLLLPSWGFAISETHYAHVLQRKVLPSVNSRLRVSSFPAGDGVSIVYGTLRGNPAKGTIVIVPGRTESIGTFTELIYDLSAMGYSVAILDHRGQGRSTRLVNGSDIGHVESFDHYVKDLSAFLNNEVFGRLPRPYFLLADSMGAAISAFYLTEYSHPFTAAAFAAPMFQIKTAPFSEWIAKRLANLLHLIGYGAGYAPTQAAFDFTAKFEQNNFTRSRARFEADMQRLRSEPAVAVGGPSVSWIVQVLNATDRIPSLATKIQIPLLIFRSGTDAFVETEVQSKFCSAARECRLVDYPAAYHSLLIEEDGVRDSILQRLGNFFSSR